MTEQNFISEFPYNFVEKGEVQAQCSSNIALVKYWGKYANQIPANPSISYTLTNSCTQTSIQFEKAEKMSVKVFLDEVLQEKFAEKIEKYFNSIQKYLPFITQYQYVIRTHNSFPHSSGIASSASGFGAIALCLIEIAEQLGEVFPSEMKKRKASFLARLGSGSACRSLYGGLAVWGKHEKIHESSDLYAVPFPFEIHENFKKIQDTVLLIHEGEKKVSSTVGHKLLENHPYAQVRFAEAYKNLASMIDILRSGDLEAFGQLVEHEALTLHAMMLTSTPAFILMKPMTVAAIEKIWNYRKLTGQPLYFTLDAGANIHLLYPEKDKNVIFNFIKNDLLKYTENGDYIRDESRL
ncbi:MAG: diphosphomevalonate decarboxylase [Flavobacteriaceae bacterium]|nr:diphosphomevalonate decarboxylase [Flavobacteriaceae bacterium]